MTEQFEIRDGWLIPFEYFQKSQKPFEKEPQTEDLNYLNEHDDAC